MNWKAQCMLLLSFSDHSHNSELQEGQFEYKYIIDGDQWTHNEAELVIGPNNDGHTNNYVKVIISVAK